MKYSEFKPTQFDHHYPIEDRENWLLVPVSQTRDSGCLDKSNFRTALDMLGGESETVEVHRFGHWGPGWFEIIIVSPELETGVQEISDKLEDYPVLDEEDLSGLQWEAAHDYWENCSMRERIEICNKYHVSIFAARRDEINENIDIYDLAD